VTLSIKIGASSEEVDLPPQAVLSLNVRKTLDGNIAIFGHKELDIVISPAKNVIVAFPKGAASDRVYDIQNRLFQFLQDRGVIVLGTVQGGDIFASMQAEYPESEEVSSLQVVLFVISRFLEAEQERFETYEEFEQEFEDRNTDPDEDESTDLGEVPHASQKGSIRPGYIYSPYGISSVYRYE
tara:strand:- start:291 stop:839 length:549 start_codon:yes stop_codon:yes gene_type:complete